jgi:peroxiredoxin
MAQQMIVRMTFSLGFLLSAAAIVAEPGRSTGSFATDYAELVRSDLGNQPADVRESVRVQRESIEKSGTVAISAEDVGRTALMRSKAQVSFTLLSDPGYRVARRFGVVYEVPPAADQVIRSHGFNLAGYYGTRTPELPLAAAYVIDRHGTIIYASRPSDPYRRADPSELVSALAALHAS